MEVGNAVLPLTPQVTEELYSFKLTVTDGDSAAGVALRAESANLWHHRVGHINGRYLDVLRRSPGNDVEFTGELQSCDVCALGKSSQKPHSKHAKNDVTQPFQLVTVDVLGELRPLAGWFQVRQQNHRRIRKVVGDFPPQGKNPTSSTLFSSTTRTPSSRQGTVWGASKVTGVVSSRVTLFVSTVGKLASNSNSPLLARVRTLVRTSGLGEH